MIRFHVCASPGMRTHLPARSSSDVPPAVVPATPSGQTASVTTWATLPNTTVAARTTATSQSGTDHEHEDEQDGPGRRGGCAFAGVRSTSSATLSTIAPTTTPPRLPVPPRITIA